MSTGKGIAIPAPKTPIQAAGTTVFTRDPDGTHRYEGRPGLMEVFKRELRSQAGGGGDPEPATSAAKPKAFSTATRAKMAASQKERQAEKRRKAMAAAAAQKKTQEGAGDSGTANPATPTGKRKPKTMTAGSSA